MKQLITAILVLLSILSVRPSRAQSPKNGLPHLEKRGHAVQLIVKGKPYLMLAGELHNSSSSSLPYLDSLWPRLTAAHLNTVLAPVYWELVEPREGAFDFRLVDGLITQARAHHMHLVLLWFGSWKNGQSSYAPSWVKHDTTRFPLVTIRGSEHLQVLSPLGTETLKADSTAFSTLMAHLKSFDGSTHTVLMVQVENEVGILGDTRDRSSLAEKALNGPVPGRLLAYLRLHRDSLRPAVAALWSKYGDRMQGNWKEVFGESPAADELFMAWQFASFIDRVAQGGKSIYPLPCYVNAWIVQPDDKLPGDYPSGGPQAHMHDVWMAAAPHIDMLVPDIYLPDFRKVSGEYAEAGKGFFIPESLGGNKGAANALYAFGAMNAIGYSPFGVEDPLPPATDTLGRLYQLLLGMSPVVTKAQQTGEIAAIIVTAEHPEEKVSLGGYTLDITRAYAWNSRISAPLGYALVVCKGPGDYYVAGANFQINFFPPAPGGIAGLDYVEEGSFQGGVWKAGRRLNGDETASSIRLADMARQRKTGMAARVGKWPSVLRIGVYTF
jgi:beta-galactosidase GanA